jgi:predicted alpha/beta hydrolase
MDARHRGQDTASALDDALADYLEWARQDFDEAVEGLRQGYGDLKAGRDQSAAETFEDLRIKYGIPR